MTYTPGSRWISFEACIEKKKSKSHHICCLPFLGAKTVSTVSYILHSDVQKLYISIFLEPLGENPVSTLCQHSFEQLVLKLFE